MILGIGTDLRMGIGTLTAWGVTHASSLEMCGLICGSLRVGKVIFRDLTRTGVEVHHLIREATA